MNATGVERLVFCGRYEQWTTIKLKENLGHVVQIDIYRKRNSKSLYSENTRGIFEMFIALWPVTDGQQIQNQQKIITVVESVFVCSKICPGPCKRGLRDLRS